MISFIFTSVGYWEELLKPLINSIYKYSGGNPVEVIAVDQGDKFGKDGRVRIIKCPEISRTYATNRALEIASGDWIAILDSDILITGEYYEEIIGLDKNIIYGPKLFEKNHFDFPTPYPCLEFWCICLHKEMYERVGGFDQNFGPPASFAEADYCFRVQDLGYNIEQRDFPFRHLHRSTKFEIHPNHMEYRAKNIEYLRKKWNLY